MGNKLYNVIAIYCHKVGIMSYLGKSKIDKTKRISLIKEVADLFDVKDGDFIYFYANDGKIIINKATKKFNGFDFEGEEIEARIREKEDEIASAEYDRFMNRDVEREYEEERSEAEELYRMYKAGKNKIEKK